MSEAPVQLLKSYQADYLSVGMDDLYDKYIQIARYEGPIGTTPAEPIFAEGCLLVHKAERKLYINQANDGAVPNFVGVGAK
jgi:hypothetical protein